MTKEDKELLLKDLCARLPYGLKYNFGGNDGCDYTMDRISLIAVDDAFPIEDCKPYLFPLSSMTKVQMKEYAHILVMSSNLASSQLIGETTQDWLDKNYFDYRGLIPKGLAIDATGLNIY